MGSADSSLREAPGAENTAIIREVLASPSRHVQLALVHVPGPAHEIEPQPYLRISYNIGPSYVIDATGPQGRQTFPCRRHSLLVIPPDTTVMHHAGMPKPAGRAYTPVRLATFRISRELLASSAMALGLRAKQAQLEHQVLAGDEVLRSLAAGLLADLRAGCPDGAQATESAATALVCRVLTRQARIGPTATAGALARVQQHIDTQLHAPLALEELAALAGMSLFHFCRVFRERLGATPHQYILSRRMEQAKRLLWSRAGDAGAGGSIVDVAMACGFGSSSHFAAQFKRYTGQTPLQWQRSGERPAGA
ncbi:MAG: helix-turn-helix transcriptional regulator [Burkholderiales bacterium]|nr:helix-turn-helix transcriptional regulator [Burkholderiales bacterium]